jgi:hypothetical protein
MEAALLAAAFPQALPSMNMGTEERQCADERPDPVE